MSRKVEVRYSVEYAVTIEFDDDESLQDAVNNIDIPEGPLEGIGCSKYVSDTFEPQSVIEANTGKDLMEEYEGTDDTDDLDEPED